MSVKGFRVKDGLTTKVEKYDYASLDNIPPIDNIYKNISERDNSIVWPVSIGYYSLNEGHIEWNSNANFISTSPEHYIEVHKDDIIRIKDATNYRYFAIQSTDNGETWTSLTNTTNVDTVIQNDALLVICVRKEPRVNFTPSDLTKVFDAITIYKKNEKEYASEIKELNEGYSNFFVYGNFQNYGLNTDGSFKVTQRYRVSNNDRISFNHDIKVSVDDGFKWGFIPFENGVAQSWVGWLTSDYIIPAGTEFSIQISRRTDVQTEIANIDEYVSKLKFKNLIKENVDNLFDAIDEHEKQIDRILSKSGNLFESVIWEDGSITEDGDHGNRSKIRTKGYISLDKINKLALWCDAGYKYYYLLYNENKEYTGSISGTTEKIVLEAKNFNASYMRIVFSFYDNSDISISESVHMHGRYYNYINEMSERINVVENLFRFEKFFSHIGVDQTTNIVIPCQSIFDVHRSKRLGFNVMELNVHKTTDDKYVCLHGTGGKFGAQFIGADGTDVSNVVISNMTLDWIKNNVRYVSKYEKYRTAPFTLEEMLYECKKWSVIPLVQYRDETEVDILNSILGLNNYILNIYDIDREEISSVVCASWTAIANAEEAVEKCRASGHNYMLGVHYRNSAFSGFTIDDWKQYTNAVHNAGYWIISAYVSPADVAKFIGIGWDAIGSTIQINEIENGNLVDLPSTPTFAGFTHTGTLENDTITLEAGQRISLSEEPESVFLGGTSLHITFSGEIRVTTGLVNNVFTSDGMSDTWISSYVEESVPKLVIQAISGTVVKELSFKASKM